MNISANFTPTILYDNPHLQFKKTKAPDGTFDWFYAHRPHTKQGQDDGVIIAPIIHEPSGDSMIFLETCRPPLCAEGKAQTGIEFPAGLIGDVRENETVKDAIKAELLEETGLQADKIKIHMNNVQSSGGAISETCTLATADIYNPKIVAKPLSDNGVIVKQHKVPVEDIPEWLKEQSKQGKSISLQTLASLYCTQAYGSNCFI